MTVSVVFVGFVHILPEMVSISAHDSCDRTVTVIHDSCDRTVSCGQNIF